MRTVSDIVNLWPSPAIFAEDLGLKTAVHARSMRRRGSIPQWYWERLIKSAQKRGIQLTLDEVKQAHEGVRQFGTMPLADTTEAA